MEATIALGVGDHALSGFVFLVGTLEITGAVLAEIVVVNEFLAGVSKGFQDAAFASFKRRRSTVREDINQSFGADPTEKPSHSMGQMQDRIEPKDEVKGKADVTPKTRSKKINMDELSEL